MLAVLKDTEIVSIVVVIGAASHLMVHELRNEKIIIAHNEKWHEGIASSIRSGIIALQKNYPACDGTLIMVVDQPYITSALLSDLIEAQKKSGKPAAACKYENTTGTPALFHQSLFAELLNLKGDRGAGKILLQRPADVAIIPFPKGATDIDTEEDYNTLLKK